ncbi:MAG: hypothetical protein QME54_05135 [Actinomycetota bacterium]|nr:hypothetical protein [Actinomycetota bacterium]
MRKFIALFVTIAFVLTISGVAWAAGYNVPLQYRRPGYPSGPHGDYADTTNKCKDCHAVHLAQGQWRLLRDNTRATACDACHGSGGLSAIIITTNEEGHTMGYTGTAPDDSDPAWSVTSFGCMDCHSPHDNNTVVLTGKETSKLLKADPDPGEALYWTGTGDESQWCSDCHSANYGLHTDVKYMGAGNTVPRYGHDCSTAGPHVTATYPCGAPDGCHGHPDFPAAPGKVSFPDNDYPSGMAPDGNDGPTCRQCHQTDGIPGVWPHRQGTNPNTGTVTSRDMLKNTFDASADKLDDVCNDCHFTPSLP